MSKPKKLFLKSTLLFSSTLTPFNNFIIRFPDTPENRDSYPASSGYFCVFFLISMEISMAAIPKTR